MKNTLIIRSDTGITHSLNEPIINGNELLGFLYNEGFQKVKQYFDKYFNMLIEKSINPESVELIRGFRESFESKFYIDVYLRIKDYKEDIEGVFDKELFINSLIEMIVPPLFFYSDLSIAVLTGNIDNLKELSQAKENNKILEEFYRLHTNQKDKEWRDKLYEITDIIYNKEKKYLNKTTCLKEAFERLPNKKEYREEFETKFKSIYEKYLKR